MCQILKNTWNTKEPHMTAWWKVGWTDRGVIIFLQPGDIVMKYGKVEWVTFTLPSLFLSVSFLSFCSYFGPLMEKYASSSQTKDKLAIKAINGCRRWFVCPELAFLCAGYGLLSVDFTKLSFHFKQQGLKLDVISDHCHISIQKKTKCTTCSYFILVKLLLYWL